MHDILHDLWVEAKPIEVFKAISTPKGLDSWWTKKSAGSPEMGAEYELFFGEDYDWRAEVIKSSQPNVLEWKMTKSDEDWHNTAIGFEILKEDKFSHVKFHHKGWKEANDHFRRSNYCWATYLRLLKRYIEHGEFVPYEHRSSA